VHTALRAALTLQPAQSLICEYLCALLNYNTAHLCLHAWICLQGSGSGAPPPPHTHNTRTHPRYAGALWEPIVAQLFVSACATSGTSTCARSGQDRIVFSLRHSRMSVGFLLVQHSAASNVERALLRPHVTVRSRRRRLRVLPAVSVRGSARDDSAPRAAPAGFPRAGARLLRTREPRTHASNAE
jgi:hypothetical protein